jgi:hypothetical protein
VGEDGAFEDYACGEAAGDEVGEVDGCVYADGGDGLAAGYSGGEL